MGTSPACGVAAHRRPRRNPDMACRAAAASASFKPKSRPPPSHDAGARSSVKPVRAAITIQALSRPPCSQPQPRSTGMRSGPDFDRVSAPAEPMCRPRDQAATDPAAKRADDVRPLSRPNRRRRSPHRPPRRPIPPRSAPSGQVPRYRAHRFDAQRKSVDRRAVCSLFVLGQESVIGDRARTAFGLHGRRCAKPKAGAADEEIAWCCRSRLMPPMRSTQSGGEAAGR